MTVVGFTRTLATQIVTGQHQSFRVLADVADEFGIHRVVVDDGMRQLAVDYKHGPSGVEFIIGDWPEVNFTIRGEPPVPMPAPHIELTNERLSPDVVEQYLAAIQWSPLSGDWERHLVARNVRRFADWARLTDPLNKEN